MLAFGFMHDGRGGPKCSTGERLQTIKSFQDVVVSIVPLIVQLMSQLREFLWTRRIPNRLARLAYGTGRLGVRKTQPALYFSAIAGGEPLQRRRLDGLSRHSRHHVRAAAHPVGQYPEPAIEVPQSGMLAQSNQGGADFPALAIPRFAEHLNGEAQRQVNGGCQRARQG